MIIDLRSDTVTRPSAGMKEAMFNAEIGDDVYGEDPSINFLERKIADYFGKEAAIFCPSATMANQIAIRLNTKPQDEIICDAKSHIYLYEGGGVAYNALSSVKLINSKYGILNASEIESQINPQDVHFPRTSLISLENTCNKGGGSFYDLERLNDIRSLADKNNLRMHLDGARLFNALRASNLNSIDLAKNFDTISVCFSKGLGCPVGAALLLNKEKEFEARRYRKVFGGGMRQAGILAAAATYALDYQIDRLSEDHKRISEIGNWLLEAPYIKHVYPHPTNIILFSLENDKKAAAFTAYLADNGIKISSFASNLLRIVTHIDFTDTMLEKVVHCIRSWR